LNSCRGFYMKFSVTCTENIPISGSVLIEKPEVFMSKCI
jgi:hypothetical protein